MKLISFFYRPLLLHVVIGSYLDSDLVNGFPFPVIELHQVFVIIIFQAISRHEIYIINMILIYI